jgi:hypothetical protein
MGMGVVSLSIPPAIIEAFLNHGMGSLCAALQHKAFRAWFH